MVIRGSKSIITNSNYLKVSDNHFFDWVYQVVRQIPEGRVTSYGAIAKYIGSPKSSRVVGYAMNAAHSDQSIPAHRVVNRIGVLTGKLNFETIDTMESRLKEEGIEVKNDQIVHFQKHFWDPSIELKDDLEDVLEIE